MTESSVNSNRNRSHTKNWMLTHARLSLKLWNKCVLHFEQFTFLMPAIKLDDFLDLLVSLCFSSVLCFDFNVTASLGIVSITFETLGIWWLYSLVQSITQCGFFFPPKNIAFKLQQQLLKNIWNNIVSDNGNTN